MLVVWHSRCFTITEGIQIFYNYRWIQDVLPLQMDLRYFTITDGFEMFYHYMYRWIWDVLPSLLTFLVKTKHDSVNLFNRVHCRVCATFQSTTCTWLLSVIKAVYRKELLNCMICNCEQVCRSKADLIHIIVKLIMDMFYY